MNAKELCGAAAPGGGEVSRTAASEGACATTEKATATGEGACATTEGATGGGACGTTAEEELAALRADLRRAGRVLGSIALRQLSRWAPALARERGVTMAVDGACAPSVAFSAAGEVHAGAEGGGAGWRFDVKRSRAEVRGFNLTFRACPVPSVGESRHA